MTDIKVPIRPAPKPPGVKLPKQNGTCSKTTDNRETFLSRIGLSRSQSAGKLGEHKKPPPRPPPPIKSLVNTRALTLSSNQKQTAQVSTVFSQRNKSGGLIKSRTEVSLSDVQPMTGMLIDLSSPPSSPTPSSDAFSVHSRGSSQMESGFEDDFDLLMISSKSSSTSDPWSSEPFTSPKNTTFLSVPFELSNEDPRSRHKEFHCPAVTSSTKPTIIRPKGNAKPLRPPPPKLRPSSTPPVFVTPTPDDWSPPMPSCPPPPPPPIVYTTPGIPPRPNALMQEKSERKKPYCKAVYDYEAGHPDDLSFKVNDIIYLTERINSEWLRGTLNGHDGMFPANYVTIVVPLESPTVEEFEKYKNVIALYTFKAETWDDLPFQEGDTVKVTKRINDQWLYGECNGRQGQFPDNYVTDVSALFPQQHFYS